MNCVVHGREGFAARHFSSLAGRAGAAGLVLALVFGASVRIAAAQRGASAATSPGTDPSEALGETLTAACRQDQAGFANHLTSDSAEAYRALPEQQRVALLKRFVLLEDPGKALLSTLDGHTVVRCEASGVVSEMRFGESQVRENLAFIAVTVPQGDDTQSVRFGLVREGGQWKLLSVGLVLLDIPALARQWSESEVRQQEQKAIFALRKIAEALKSYQTAYGKLPERSTSWVRRQTEEDFRPRRLASWMRTRRKAWRKGIGCAIRSFRRAAAKMNRSEIRRRDSRSRQCRWSTARTAEDRFFWIPGARCGARTRMAPWPRRKIRAWGATKRSPKALQALSSALPRSDGRSQGGAAPGACTRPSLRLSPLPRFREQSQDLQIIHTSVTMIPNAPYHSMYLGAPA